MFIRCQHWWDYSIDVEIDTTLTALIPAGFYKACWEVRAFVDDTGNSQTCELYAEYSPDQGTTWFEDQEEHISIGAGEAWTNKIFGGFYGRLSAIKDTEAETAEVEILVERQQCSFREVTLQDETTTEVDTDGEIVYNSGDDTKNCDAVAIFIDDNENIQDLTYIVYMAPNEPGDSSPDWHVETPATSVQTAKDRRAVVIVRNVMGRMIKVVLVKDTEAENVVTYVKGRLPYYRQELIP
ncbi:MAG: hypothetical protein PVF58_14280 [Candidatus Methanofastidiosia archaeon]|jgi:hypothetical protein